MRISHKTYPLSSWRREVLAASMAALFSLPCFCQTGSVQNARGKMESLAEQDSKVEMFERSCIRRLKEAEFSHSKTVFKGFFFLKDFFSNFSILKALEPRYCISPWKTESRTPVHLGSPFKEFLFSSVLMVHTSQRSACSMSLFGKSMQAL